MPIAQEIVLLPNLDVSADEHIYYTSHYNFRVTVLHDDEELIPITTTITAALNQSLLARPRSSLTVFPLEKVAMIINPGEHLDSCMPLGLLP